MREIEFLPDWYPQARRRQSFLRLHLSSALLVRAEITARMETARPGDALLDELAAL